jgi:pimeloyl-ACP methyl ester carboxylesterase
MIYMTKIPGTIIEFVLDKPLVDTHKVVLFLPGISGGALSDKYDSLSGKVRSMNFAFLRVSMWEGIKDIEHKTLSAFKNDIDTICSFLAGLGYTEIHVVGKSFGATLLLLQESKNFKSVVLWAPVLSISEDDSNIYELQDRPLNEIDSLKDIVFDSNFLSRVMQPHLVVHGEEDHIIDISNSEKLVSYLPQGTLLRISNMGHSPESELQREFLFTETIHFLSTHP